MKTTNALDFRKVAGADSRRGVTIDGQLPTIGELLASGGDDRIVPDVRGRNRYGCTATPDPGLGALGSSTASTISEAAFEAAEALRRKIGFAARKEPATTTYARELDRVRRELLSLCGVGDLGAEVIFGASGTDLHLIAGQLATGHDGRPAIAITGDATETGSSVPSALGGRHFSGRSALGIRVLAGTAIGEGDAAEVATVALRHPDGTLRAASQVDVETEALVERAVESGRRVLLILLDQSKTGLISPSIACALGLNRRFAGAVDVLVDACQFRIGASTVRAYLEHGFAVALTGSKFVTGPAFSGALLVPREMASGLSARPVPRALMSYSARAEWPADWDSAAWLPAVANWGLLVRWEAALEELRAFRALPERAVAGFLRAFAIAVTRRFADDARIVPLPTRALDRRAIAAAPSWDEIPTIFPFVLRRTDARWLTPGETLELHRELGRGADRHQLGQPLDAGVRDGTPVSSLRLCASARLVVEALEFGGARQGEVMARAIAALDRATALVSR